MLVVLAHLRSSCVGIGLFLGCFGLLGVVTWFSIRFLMSFLLLTNIANTIKKKKKKTLFIENDGLSTECEELMRMLWQQTLGNESETIKFFRPKW